MATLKEKEDLIESFKGPFYYHIRLWGYGAEQSFINISEQAYEFWNGVQEEHGDGPVVTYVLNAEDFEADRLTECEDFDDLDPVTIPREAMFMHNEDGEGSTYYEPWDQFDATWAPSLDGTNISIDRVDSEEYGATVIEEVIDSQEVDDLISEVQEESDYELEVYKADHGYGDNFVPKGQHICQFMSAEKGTFFETVIQTNLPFVKNKLEFAVAEAPNGEDLIYAVYYDGEELDNNGGDTTGKGYYTYLWKQEF